MAQVDFKTNTSDMSSEGHNIVQNSDTLREQISSMESKVDKLLAIWDGDDAVDFGSSFNTMEQSFTALQGTLNDLGNANVQVAGMFEEGEAERAHDARNLEGV